MWKVSSGVNWSCVTWYQVGISMSSSLSWMLGRICSAVRCKWYTTCSFITTFRVPNLWIELVVFLKYVKSWCILLCRLCQYHLSVICFICLACCALFSNRMGSPVVLQRGPLCCSEFLELVGFRSYSVFQLPMRCTTL